MSFIIPFMFVLINVTSARSLWKQTDIASEIGDFDNLTSHLQHLEESLYGLPDDETGRRVAEWSENMTTNPEELGSYAEGDILFPLGNGRNGLRANSARWPNGVVPYIISPYFSKFFRILKAVL
ncbi:hypothetical protein ANTPLA_LOCUS4568 [Anthophora plagiata]